MLTADIINQCNILFTRHAETLAASPVHHDRPVSSHARRNLAATSEREAIKLNRLKVSCENSFLHLQEVASYLTPISLSVSQRP